MGIELVELLGKVLVAEGGDAGMVLRVCVQSKDVIVVFFLSGIRCMVCAASALVCGVGAVVLGL